MYILNYGLHMHHLPYEQLARTYFPRHKIMEKRPFVLSKENPSCRWSQRLCVAAGVDCADAKTITRGYEGCCAAEHRPIVQERAWTSPVWYSPAAIVTAVPASQ